MSGNALRKGKIEPDWTFRKYTRTLNDVTLIAYFPGIEVWGPLDSSGLELQVPITRVVGSSLRKFPAFWFLPRFAVVNPLPVLPLSIFGFRGTISSYKLFCYKKKCILNLSGRRKVPTAFCQAQLQLHLKLKLKLRCLIFTRASYPRSHSHTINTTSLNLLIVRRGRVIWEMHLK